MAVLSNKGDPGLEAEMDRIKAEYPLIVSLELSVGTDRDGDPAAWVMLVLRDEDSPVTADGKVTEAANREGGFLEVATSIEQAIKRLGYVPNVHFRTTSEQELVDADRAQRPS